MDKYTKVGIAAVAIIVVVVYFYYQDAPQKEGLERRWEMYDQGLVFEGPIHMLYEDSDPIVSGGIWWTWKPTKREIGCDGVWDVRVGAQLH